MFHKMLFSGVLVSVLLSNLAHGLGYVNKKAAIMLTSTSAGSVNGGRIVAYFPKVVFSFHEATGNSGVAFDEDNVSNSWLATSLNDQMQHQLHETSFLNHLRMMLSATDFGDDVQILTKRELISDFREGGTPLQIFMGTEVSATELNLDQTSMVLYIGSREVIGALHAEFEQTPAKIYSQHFDRAELALRVYEERPGFDVGQEPVLIDLPGIFLVSPKVGNFGRLVVPSVGGDRADDGAQTINVPVTSLTKNNQSISFVVDSKAFLSELVTPASASQLSLECIKLQGRFADASACKSKADGGFELIVNNFDLRTGSGARKVDFYTRALGGLDINIYRGELSMVSSAAASAPSEPSVSVPSGAPPSGEPPAGDAQAVPPKKLRLGVTFDVEADKLNEGAKVTKVAEGSPAESIGIVVGDVIIQVDLTTVKNSTDAIAAVAAAGSSASLRVLRPSDGITRIMIARLRTF